MPERLRVDASDIGQALAFLSLLMAGMADRAGKQAKDMHVEFEAAIALGLLMARRQPELPQAFLEHWNSTRNTSADDFLDGMLWAYSDFRKPGHI